MDQSLSKATSLLEQAKQPDLLELISKVSTEI
jgi:hypothetical protein